MILRSRTAVLIRKELTQFFRARLMLVVIVYLYTAEVLMCTYSMSFDVRDLPTAIADLDGSPLSRRLKESLVVSGYFRVEHEGAHAAQAAERLARGSALAAVIIPPEFSARLLRGEPAPLQLLLDGTNVNAASVAQGYVRRIVRDFAHDLAEWTGEPPLKPAVELRPRIWYNSELNFAHFQVLSMVAIAGMMVGMIMAAAGIVRERESGTIEQILVTPVGSAELITAKMFPPLLVGLLALFPSMAIAAAVGVPLRGSVLLFVGFSAVFLVSSMSIGILIATVAGTLQQALLISFLLLFPILFLSGTVVPLESMPVVLQYMAAASPLRHYMEAILGVFFKGVGLETLWPSLLAMATIATVLLTLALNRLRRWIQ